jgi:hypothetical protein
MAKFVINKCSFFINSSPLIQRKQLQTNRILTQSIFDFITQEQNGYLSLLDLTKIYFFQTENKPLLETNLTIKKFMNRVKLNTESSFYEILKFWKNKTKTFKKEKDTNADFFENELKRKSLIEKDEEEKEKKKKSSKKKRSRKTNKREKKKLSVRRYSVDMPKKCHFKLKKKMKKALKRSKSQKMKTVPKHPQKPKKSKKKFDWEKMINNDSHTQFVFEQIMKSKCHFTFQMTIFFSIIQRKKTSHH